MLIEDSVKLGCPQISRLNMMVPQIILGKLGPDQEILETTTEQCLSGLDIIIYAQNDQHGATTAIHRARVRTVAQSNHVD
jgi:hypothetical protein